MTIRRAAVATAVSGVVLMGRRSLIDCAHSVWMLQEEAKRSLWFNFLDVFGEDQFRIFVGGSLFITIVWYWLIGAVYTLMDIHVKPEGMRKYKIQPGTNEPLDPVRLKQVIGQILYNQTLVGFPTIYVGAALMSWRRPPPIRQIPDAHWVLAQFIFFALVEEVWYYYVHRLLHGRHLYKAIHKRHHEWTSPIAITAMYCHPVEQVLANLAPVFFGPFIVNAHLSTYLSWFALAVLFTLSEHSGYHLPFMTSSEYHDYHHYSFSNNFGFLGIMDSIHNTNDQFKRSIASSRHYILKSLRSAREEVPDPALSSKVLQDNTFLWKG